MNEAKIKLAEAMGWRVEDKDRIYIPATDGMTNGRYGYLPHMSVGALIPDPFTDANDDYAVLKWMRSDMDMEPTHHEWIILFNINGNNYQIGDYARAACKVLGIEVLA